MSAIYGNSDIGGKIVITYRRTSRMSMRIGKNGEVRVSVPLRTTKSEVHRFVEGHREWIERMQEKVQEQLRRRDDFYAQLPLSTRRQKTEAAQRLNAVVRPMVERYSILMGVQPSAITYRATISKWGSCNPCTHRLQFSTYLLLLPNWCIEHVVVHELAHLLVPNHSLRFYAVMDRFFPRWREARAETRRISRMEKQ